MPLTNGIWEPWLPLASGSSGSSGRTYRGGGQGLFNGHRPTAPEGINDRGILAVCSMTRCQAEQHSACEAAIALINTCVQDTAGRNRLSTPSVSVVPRQHGRLTLPRWLPSPTPTPGAVTRLEDLSQPRKHQTFPPNVAHPSPRLEVCRSASPG